MPTFLPATITDRKEWDEGLFSLVLDRSVPFVAGQFLTLSRVDGGDRRTRRAYSVASAPGEPLEFLIVEVEDGAVSPLLRALEPGDPLFVSDRGKGLFTLDEVPDGRDLWLVATGTGFAPYRSLLRAGEVFDRFEHVVMVYGTRRAAQHAYREELQALCDNHHDRFTVVGLTSREPATGTDLSGRITDRFADGRLERAADRLMSAEHSQVMLCGNPAMISEMLVLLSERGLQRNSRRDPGQVTTEKYW